MSNKRVINTKALSMAWERNHGIRFDGSSASSQQEPTPDQKLMACLTPLEVRSVVARECKFTHPTPGIQGGTTIVRGSLSRYE